MSSYQARYPEGCAVRILRRDQLLEFQSRWKYHHNVRDDQLEHGGRIVKVRGISFYHGGDTLYQLDGVPGYWHEECLQRPPDAPEDAIARYQIGEIARIADHMLLEAFRAEWKYIHPLWSEHMGYAERLAKIESIEHNYCFRAIYGLEAIPGYWYEDCLRPAEPGTNQK